MPDRRSDLRDWAVLVSAPLTGGRMKLVWRLFGLVLLILWLQHMNEDTTFGFFAKSAAPLDFLALCGASLLIAGPSLVILLATAAAGLWFFIAVLRREPTLEFVADEYFVQAGLPIIVVIITLIHLVPRVVRGGPSRDPQLDAELDEVHARVFRIFTVTTLAFAGVHKLNADFFGPSSCARLGNRLETWWSLPFEVPVAEPLGVVTLELLSAALLLCYPRLGILAVVYVMAGLGHIGPVAFASTCVVMSLAFLDRGDIVLVRRFMARSWGLVVAANLLVIATSFSTYDARLPWLKYGLLEIVLVSVACVVVGIGLMRLRTGPGLRRRLVPAALRWWRRPPTIMPGLASWLALALVVNGMTPYLGVKYRFSVAMLSNLRADQERWNSFVVPDWVRLRKTTPHVIVDWQPVGDWTLPKVKRGHHYLDDGLFLGPALEAALQDAAKRHARGRLTLTHRGQTASFDLPVDTLGAMTWVKSKSGSVLWQERLGPGDAPQTCVH